jgi:hypothetical protein
MVRRSAEAFAARESRAARALTLTLTLVFSACLAVTAEASQVVKMDTSFAPDKLGANTTVSFGFRISSTGGGVPSPLVSVDLRLPAGMGLFTSTLGLGTCYPVPLLAQGPEGCPPDARVGFGRALAEVVIADEVMREAATVTAFMGPPDHERIVVLFYADGESPVSTQLVFPGQLYEASGVYGARLSTEVPLIPTMPEGPDISVVRFASTIGPSHLTYVERAHGRTVSFRPEGITVPVRCPRGGFPFAADFGFQDGTHVVARHLVPCPPRTHRAAANRPLRLRAPRSRLSRRPTERMR